MSESGPGSTESLLGASKRVLRAALSETGISIKDQSTLQADDSSSITSYISCSTAEYARPSIRNIPFNDILAAKYVDSKSESNSREVEVTFASKRKSQLVPESTILEIDDIGIDDVVQEIYTQSYRGSSPRKSILVLVNPHGGKGKAIKLFLTKAQPIFKAAGCTIKVEETRYSRHASDIVRDLDISKYDIIACASGDGIPYEVFNGLYQRPDRANAFNKLAITQIPCGSGNAMAESCHGTGEPSFAALSIIKAHTVNIDLMAVTQDNKTSVSFLSQTLGVIADSDINTEHLRFLGAKRFDLGVAYKVFQRAKYPCEISIKYAAESKDEVRDHYEEQVKQVKDLETEITEDSFTLKYDPSAPVPDDWTSVDQEYADNIGIFYTGKMPFISKGVQFFPAALPNDGTIDLIMLDARTSIMRQAPILLSLESGQHVNAPEIQHSKVIAYRLTPKYPKGLLSIDGERYELKETQVEVLPGAAKSLLRNGVFAETDF